MYLLYLEWLDTEKDECLNLFMPVFDTMFLEYIPKLFKSTADLSTSNARAELIIADTYLIVHTKSQICKAIRGCGWRMGMTSGGSSDKDSNISAAVR